MKCSMFSGGVLMLAIAAGGAAAVSEEKKTDSQDKRNVPTEGNRSGSDKHDHMRKCAEICADCQVECDNCFQHCASLVTEGKKEHAAAMRSCVDCAEACKLCASLCARNSDFSAHAAECCAKCCEACAAICEKTPDDKHMAACAKSCQECAKACRDMAGMKK